MFVFHSLLFGIILSLASFALGAEEEKNVANSELRSPSDSVPSAILANAPPPPQAVLATQQQKQQQQQEESDAEEKKNVPLVGGRQPSQFVPLVPFRAGQFVLPRRVNGARAVPFRTSWNIAGGTGTNRGGRGPIIGPDGSLIRPTETEAIALLAGRGGRGGGFFRQPIIGTQNGSGINGNDEKRKQEEEKRREEKRQREEEKNRKEEEERVKGGEKNRKEEEKNREDEEKKKEEETESVLKREQLKKEGKTAEEKRVWEKDSANIGEKGQREWRKRENEKEKEEREKEEVEEKERERKKNGKGREEKEEEKEKEEREKEEREEKERERKKNGKGKEEKEEEKEKEEREKEEREEKERERKKNGKGREEKEEEKPKGEEEKEEREEKERERKKNGKGREEKEEEKPKEEEELIIEEEQKGATGGKKEDRNRKGQLVVKMSGGKVILEREAEGPAQDKVPTKCEDKAQNCGANSDYCADAYYQELMEFNCAKTCKVCLKDIKNRLKVPPGLKFPAEKEPRGTEEEKPAQWTNKCRDLSERCQFWTRHGFCDSRLFHHDLKKRFCAYSCGLCQSSNSDNGKATRGEAEAVPLTEDGQ
ncbi:hypothetical protein niasHT_037686 [Heterodera trifolii]|uniref:ShKT domain-containing protein n=1 Tax=Heterodera trifolii TaxID=157864 RepID=A0ABD2IJB2_9BILA